MQVVVIGGTGLIGSRVVNRLRDRGASVAVGSLRTGVDAYHGRGLAALLEGAQVVVDATNLNRPAHEYEQARDFFETCTRNLLRVEEAAGVGHHVAVSMIGARHIDSSFFRSKAAQEREVAAARVPHSLLRTTMLHELVPRLVDRAATTHLVRLPPVRVQPVAADDVAAEIVRLALGVPLNGTFEIAGPDECFLDELARQVLDAAGDTRRVLADHRALFLGARLEPGTSDLLPAWRRTATTFQEAWSPRPGPGRSGHLATRAPHSHRTTD